MTEHLNMVVKKSAMVCVGFSETIGATELVIGASFWTGHESQLTFGRWEVKAMAQNSW